VKIAIWGLGSIGKRHWENFKKAKFEVCGISVHQTGEGIYSSLEECLDAGVDVVFVCNETAKHYESLRRLMQLGFKGGVIVEKPLFSAAKTLDTTSFRFLVVSYQLRLNPLIQHLKFLIHGQKILTALFYVGQYLPQWRPGRDYRETYSAHQAQGGGVLRDLSHELDLAVYLTGNFERLVSKLDRVSALELDVEDQVNILAQNERCGNLSIHLNYLDKTPQRFILLNTEAHTYRVDLIEKKLVVDGKEKELEHPGEDEYLELAKRIKAGAIGELTSYDEGFHILNTIEAAENSSREAIWKTI
jgi:predicted dehydrogenase